MPSHAIDLKFPINAPCTFYNFLCNDLKKGVIDDQKRKKSVFLIFKIITKFETKIQKTLA